MSWEIENWFK